MGHRQMKSTVIIGRERHKNRPRGLEKTVDAKIMACWWWFAFKRWLQTKFEGPRVASSGAEKDDVHRGEIDRNILSEKQGRGKGDKLE